MATAVRYLRRRGLRVTGGVFRPQVTARSRRVVTMVQAGTTYAAILSETLPFPQEDVELSSQMVLAFGRPITVLADGFLVDQTAVVLSGSVNGVMLMEEFIRCLQAAPTDTVPPDGSPVGDYEVINGTDDGLYFSNGVKTYVETLF